MHARRQIREAVASLITGLQTTAGSVFINRLYALQESNLPCLVVTTTGDNREYLTCHQPSQVEVTVLVQIEGYVRATSNLDNTLDQISLEVETAIANSDFNVELVGTKIEDSVLSNVPVGVVSLFYKIKVHVSSNAPDIVF